CWIQSAPAIAHNIQQSGFQILNADQLKDWMTARIERGAAGSVCVFAQDIAPDTVAETPTGECTIRRYLNAGGRIVWVGDVPFFYQGKLGRERINWGCDGQKG